jgi:regulator of protease activity HflC (stomatin/prohibitin superfamily)
MRNFSFSSSYMDAINDKVTQEQLRLAAENKPRTVEAEQKQKVAIAEAEALKIQNAALSQNRDVLELGASRSSAPRPSAGTASCRRTCTRTHRSRSCRPEGH